MIHLTRGDVQALLAGNDVIEWWVRNYPELLSEDEIDTLKIMSELIRSLK